MQGLCSLCIACHASNMKKLYSWDFKANTKEKSIDRYRIMTVDLRVIRNTKPIVQCMLSFDDSLSWIIQEVSNALCLPTAISQLGQVPRPATTRL